MKSKPDWLYLRPALIIMSMALLFSIIIKLVGIQYYQEMSALYDQKNAEHSDVKMKLAEVREEKEIVASFSESFASLEKSGQFDGKQRIDWVDAVNSARQKMKLPLVSYLISPQSPYVADYLQTDGYASVMLSSVKLEASLLHEGDMVDLFGWMESQAAGQLHLSHCELRRTEAQFGYYADRSNMDVSCDFSWFTIIPESEFSLDG